MLRLPALFPALIAITFFLQIGCARLPVKNREDALRQIDASRVTALLTNPLAQDDLPISSLLNAVKTEIDFWTSNPRTQPLVFGEKQFSQTEYVAALRLFVDLASNATSPETFYALIADEFDFYEVYGGNSWGEVFITSYFAPVIEGSTQPSQRFSVPLYQAPDDLVTINLGLFDPKYGPGKKLKGRLSDRTVIPYYTRDEIDGKNVISNKQLEICWVDPVDAFFLQIQGSGTVRLDDGRNLFINYAEQNGHPYEPIGKFLLEKIPLEDINLYTLETYLRGLPVNEMQSYFNKNPSYVFFRVAEENAITFLGVPATAGRTIATDRRFFPKGALAFLQFERPIFPTPTDPLPASFKSVGRFVLDQDVGGAISGGGRVDLFWGHGDESKRAAGVMKGRGHLFYLAPKRS